MATFSFNNTTSPKVKEKVDKKYRIKLIKHPAIDAQNEYYTYIDAEGKDRKFSGIIINNNGSYVGKVINTNKIILTYHPTVESVIPQKEYFSYIDMNGDEKVYSGEVEFDLEKNSYIGEVKEVTYTEEIIDLFKEN